jgi:hypothetical protein
MLVMVCFDWDGAKSIPLALTGCIHGTWSGVNELEKCLLKKKGDRVDENLA